LIRAGAWATISFLPIVLLRPAIAAGSLQIATTSLPAATAGAFYNQQIVTTGGTCAPPNSQQKGTATSSIDSGALPPGLSVPSPTSTEQWSIQGTPTASGTFQFVLHVYWSHTAISPFDSNCTDDAVQPLSIVVQGPTVPLSVSPAQIGVTYHIAHFPPAPVTVQVNSASTVASNFTVQATTASGGSWLSVTPSSGVTPAQLSVSLAVSGLKAGVYTGSITLASGSANPVAIPVSLTVVADTNVVLQASPASMTFTFTTGGANPAPQVLSISISGDSVIFQANLNAPPTGKWLSVTPTGAATPAQLTVSVDPKGLSPGNYTGTITLNLAGLSAIAQTIPVTLAVQALPILPAIAANGVVNAANLTSAMAPGTWVSIFGSSLSATTRPWASADFVGGKLPAQLDGVSVTIDGKSAAVAYVSPTQINVLAPDDANTGLVTVQVTAPAGTSTPTLALEQTVAPAFFQFRAPAASYVAGTHADGSYLAGPALVQQGIAGTPAKPGETIVIYGTGFGASQPAVSATAPVPSALPLANQQALSIRIGGLDSAIAFAGLISPGVYQFNLMVPEVPDGDVPVVAEWHGLLTKSDLLLSVQH
jgi:uncharacterized protein (TIGR03437 family)